MARTADHAARRAQISRAAVDIALEQELAKLTVATCARVAGVSVGLVQHYFPTKEALMRRAYEDLLGAVDDRVVELVEAGERQGRPIREMVVDALGQLLPLDDARRAECIARDEFQALAGRHPELAEVAVEHQRSHRDRVRHVVDNAKECGEVVRDADSEGLADDLWATVVGIGAAALLDESFPAPALLEAAAKRTFPGECSRAVN